MISGRTRNHFQYIMLQCTSNLLWKNKSSASQLLSPLLCNTLGGFLLFISVVWFNLKGILYWVSVVGFW